MQSIIIRIQDNKSIYAKFIKIVDEEETPKKNSKGQEIEVLEENNN
jgi:hypothetical protein